MLPRSLKNLLSRRPKVRDGVVEVEVTPVHDPADAPVAASGESAGWSPVVTQVAPDFAQLPPDDRMDLSGRPSWWLLPITSWLSIAVMVGSFSFYRFEVGRIDGVAAEVRRQVAQTASAAEALETQIEENTQVFAAAGDLVAWKRAVPQIQPLVVDLLAALSAPEGNRLSTFSIGRQPGEDTSYSISFILSGDPRHFSDVAKSVDETLRRRGWVTSANPKRMDASKGSSLDFQTTFWAADSNKETPSQ